MTGKKSFILYADVQQTVKLLSDKQAGELFKHILSYVNDEEPKLNDPLLSIAFEPIKQSLIRDLDKWKVRSKKNSENAKLRWSKKSAKESKTMQSYANHADSDSDSDNVSDIVIDILKHFNKCFNKKARLIPNSIQMKYKELLKDGYELEDILNAMTGARADKWHIDRNYEVCTLFFFTNAEKIDRYSTLSIKKNKYVPTR